MSRPDERRALEQAWSRSQQVVGRRIGDEFVLVPLAGRGADLDSIYNLNAVAAFVWERLDGRRTGERIVDELVARFEVERARATADYLELLATLAGLKAVVPAGPGVE